MTRPALMFIAAALAAHTMAPQSHDFPSGNVFGNVGQFTALTLNPGGASGDQYTVHYFASITINGSSTFSTASLVVAIDGNDGSGWVERASFTHNCSYLSQPPPWPTRLCTFSHEQPTITVPGLGAGDGIRVRAKSFTQGSPTGATFAIRGGDGAGSNPETFNGVNYTTVDPTYTVAVTPDGGSQAAFSGSTGNQATFTVQNFGNQGPLTYSLSIVGCGAPLTNCSLEAGSVNVSPGTPVNAIVRFDATGATGTGTIALRATHGGSGTLDDGSINVNVSAAPTFAVQVGPDPGSHTTTAGTTGNVVTFTVRNDGNQGTLQYALSVVTCAAPLASCSSDSATITVAQNDTRNATVRFNAPSTTGAPAAIVLRATHTASGANNDGTINVTVNPAPSFAVEVGDPPAQSIVAGAVNQVANFPVTNNGNQGTITYALSIVTCSAPLTNCRLDAASVPVGQSTTANAVVRYDAQVAGGSGTITLRATHTPSGTFNDGTLSVTVAAPTYTVVVGPDGGVGGALIGSSGNQVTFTVRNDGNQGTLTYSLSVVGCSAPVVNCTAAASIPVAQNTTGNAIVQFDAQNTAGTGTIRLRATHPSGASDEGTINVTITTGQADDFAAGNLIDALGETAEANLDPGDANSGLYTAHFFVEVTINAHSSTFGNAALVVAIDANDGSGWVERGSFTYNCSYLSGPPPYPTRTCPALAHDQQSITAAGLGLNDDIRLRAKSLSSSNGAGGSFRVRGGDGAGPNPETYSGVTYGTNLPPSYAVAVEPDPGSQTVTGGSTGNVATFTVRNDGNQGTLTYALSVQSCGAPVVSCTSDSTTITVGQNVAKNATVRFNAQSTSGAGVIVLRATHAPSGTNNDGTINVTVTPPPSFAVEVGDPPAQSIAANSTNHSASFPVTNNGNQGTLTYALSIIQCSAPPLTGCTSDSASLTIGQGLSKNAVVRFAAQNSSGPGTIVVRATHGASGTSNDGTLSVTVAAASYVVQVGPDPGTSAAGIGSTGNVATFQVTNQGNQGPLTYALSVVGCTAPLLNCTSDSASLQVLQGSTRDATVRFNAQNTTGTGTITFRATHTASGATNDGTINVTIAALQTDDFTSGNAITAVTGTAEANLDPADAVGGSYTVQYFVQATINAHSSTFGNAALEVAIDANDGSGWVERASFTYNCSYLSGPPPYPVRTCPASTAEQKTITVPGLGLNDDIRLRAKSFATSNGAGGSFVIRGGDGSGSNPETYNGVTYQRAVPPSYAVEVADPTGQSVVAGSTGNVATFAVQNLGNQGTLTYALSIQGCGAPVVSCTSDSATITIGQGLTKNATVRFNAQTTTGPGSIVLRATHTASGTLNDGTIIVTVTPPPSYAVEVGDPPSQSVASGSTNHFASFPVTNNGNQGTLTYALNIVQCTAPPLTSCTSDSASLSIGQNLTKNAIVRFAAQNANGPGTIVLRATHALSGTTNDGTLSVTVAPASFAVQVGPDPGTASAPMGSTGNVATFSVKNEGNQGTLNYALSVVGCTAPLFNCVSDSTSLSVIQGSTRNATVRFNAQNTTGTGTITFRATHTVSGATNDGRIDVTIAALQTDDFASGNAITAVNGTAEVNLDPGDAVGGSYVVHYFVQATINAHSSTFGSAALVVAIDANDGSGWVERASVPYNCSYLSGPPPYPSRTCPASSHEQQTITVAGLGPNDDIRLRASSFSTSNGAGGSFVIRGGDGAGSNPETYNGVTYQRAVPPSWAVLVAPDAGSQTAFTSSTNNVATFTVKNDGNQGTITYALSVPTCGAPVAGCAADSATLTLTQGETRNAVVRFNTQNATATGAIVLRATHGPSGAFDEGTISVSVAPAPSYAAVVEPNAGSQSARGGTTANVATFSVKNDGNQGTLTYALSFPACSPPVTNCVADSTITLVQGEMRNTTVRFDAQNTTGSGTVTLRATHLSSGTGDNGTITVSVVALSYVSAPGVFTLDPRFLLQEVADDYDEAGRIERLTDARNAVTDYVYGGNPENAFLTQLRRWKGAPGGASLVTDVQYTDGDVTWLRDESGSIRTFSYDVFGRLRQVKNHLGTVVRSHGYTYSRARANGWTFQPTSPNAIVDSTFLQYTPTLQVVVRTEYVDGVGRTVQQVVKDGTRFYVAATQYDSLGRVWRVWNPYRRSTAGFDPAFAAASTDSANAYHGTTAARPYVETLYRPDPLNRVSRVIPQYIGSAPALWTATAYGVNADTGYAIVETTDEAGKRTQRVTDLFGNVVRSILAHGTPDVTITQFTNNVLGQRTEARDPRGLATTYAIDTRGMLLSRTSPDAGTLRSKYDRAGSIRYAQDANQAALGQVYFTNYDFAGRSLVSGLGTAPFESLDPLVGALAAFETNQANWLVARAYDAKPLTTAAPWNLFSSQITNATMTNLNGRLAAVASKSNGAWQLTLFSYDTDGHVGTRYTYTQPNSGSGLLTAVNTTVTYLRDLRGSATRRLVNVGGRTFYQWYEYDGRGLLARTFAATTSTKPTSPDVTDTLRPDGIVHNYRYAGGPLVPIRYTIRGQVERIGDPAVTTFPFSARYAYLPNGLVDTAEFSSAGSPAQQQRYRYALGPSGYDALNRLRSADFSSWTGTQWTVTPTYDLSGITYDASGNLRSLRRNRDTGSTFIDNLSYTIAGTSNRLDTVTDAVLSTPEPWDAESGNFTYDLTGNVVTAPAPYSLTAVAYDPSNLPLSITRNNTTTRYRYDDAGQRIYKQVNGGNIEVYIREGGTPLAVFTLRPNGNHQSSYFNLVWEARVIGRLPSSGSRSYYHFDALGSTRAVTQGATITESYDFEPWGLLMAGRTRAGTTKEGFTSKERDTETGLDYFGARYYMPAIGRWAAVDPVSDDMAEWSPYNYVYNNPLTRTDPDGRQPPHMWLPPESAEGAQQVVNLTGHFIKGAAKAAVGIVTLVHTALTLDENTPDFGPFTGIQQAVQTLRTGTPEEKAEAAGGLTFGAVTAAYGLRGAGGPKPVALTERAGQIHGVLDPIAQTQRTTAVLETNTGRIAAGGVRDLTPAQRRAAVAGGDQPARLPGAHAEVTALKAAERSGATPQAIGTSRNICPACRDYIQSKGGVVTGPRTAVWPKKDQ